MDPAVPRKPDAVWRLDTGRGRLGSSEWGRANLARQPANVNQCAQLAETAPRGARSFASANVYTSDGREPKKRRSKSRVQDHPNSCLPFVSRGASLLDEDITSPSLTALQRPERC